MGTPRKINAILLNIKIIRTKLVNMCRYKLAICWQTFTKLFITWVNILQNVLGGLLFLTHTVDSAVAVSLCCFFVFFSHLYNWRFFLVCQFCCRVYVWWYTFMVAVQNILFRTSLQLWFWSGQFSHTMFNWTIGCVKYVCSVLVYRAATVLTLCVFCVCFKWVRTLHWLLLNAFCSCCGFSVVDIRWFAIFIKLIDTEHV